MTIRNIRNLIRVYCFGINVRLTSVIIFGGMVRVASPFWVDGQFPLRRRSS